MNEQHDSRTQRSSGTRDDERGTVLVVVLVLMIGFAGFAQAALTKTMAEQKKVQARLLARQVQAEADGQLELARNLVNAAQYTASGNAALVDGRNAIGQVIPGTDVRVDQVGGTLYYVLRTEAARNGVVKSSEAVVRESSPASAFNLFVIDHPVGVSGAPRGAIHTNRHVDFFFRGGNYRDTVTAGEGFRYMAGASPENTTFLGNTNSSAPASDLLAEVDLSTLSGEADVLSVPEAYIAEITFEGATGRVDLYDPAHAVEVERTRNVEVLTGYETETYFVNQPIYETETYEYEHDVYVPVEFDEVYQEDIWDFREILVEKSQAVYEEQAVEYTVNVPVFETQTLSRDIEQQVWLSYDDVEVGANSSGGTVGASSLLDGFWTTETVTEEYTKDVIVGHREEIRTRNENVLVGYETRSITEMERFLARTEERTRTRTRHEYSHTETRTGTREVITGYEAVMRTRDVPVYETVTETYNETVDIDEEFVRTEFFPIDGTVYLGGDVRKIEGQLDGRLSLIANGKVNITDNIQYVDSDGDTRMINGLDPNEPYGENPDYDGASLLAIMARDNVQYSRDSPTNLEVNASLMSVEGSVGFEGILVSDDGGSVSTDSESSGVVKNSLRRLGGIVSRFRPVATYIDESGWVGSGFQQGSSIMDQNLLLTSGNNAPPPFTFEAPYPTWILQTSGSRLGTID